MAVNSQKRRNDLQRSERGYVLLTLLLIIALGIIFAATMVTSISFDIKRDREEEMIHRGVQYSRAIRAYYKKFGRYPVKIEDLESANNMRFLRKRYKDPLTGKDFKLLHFGEVKLTFSGGVGGGGINGASSLNNGSLNNNNLNNNSALGSQLSQLGGVNSGGGLSNSVSGPGGGQTPYGGTPNTPAGNTTNTPTDSNQDSNATTVSPVPGQKQADAGDAATNVTFGGGPIVGVASTSKKETIREFNHKKKYNEWQFIYDPATDRGGLLMTPNQPGLQGFGQGQNLNGQNTNGQGTNGQNSGGFNNGLGGSNSGGMQNTNPTQPGNAGPGTPPSDPGTPPPQQQQ